MRCSWIGRYLTMQSAVVANTYPESPNIGTKPISLSLGFLDPGIQAIFLQKQLKTQSASRTPDCRNSPHQFSARPVLPLLHSATLRERSPFVPLPFAPWPPAFSRSPISSPLTMPRCTLLIFPLHTLTATTYFSTNNPKTKQKSQIIESQITIQQLEGY